MTGVFDLRGQRVWVAGHRGTVGSAVCRRLDGEGCEVIIVDRAELDLRRQADVESWMTAARPDVVVLSAATVGGIASNSARPADFLYDNLAIQNSVIHTAHQVGVRKLVFVGSSCIYPQDAAQPFRESAMLSGPLEPAHEWYAVAKIAGVKLCQAYRNQFGSDFISVIPSNIYGPGDNFHPENSRAVAALLRRIHQAKRSRAADVVVWGSGEQLRELLFVDDLADALVLLTKRYSAPGAVNVGSGHEVSIHDLAAAIAKVVGYTGAFTYDRSRPDGMPRSAVDCSVLRDTGWAAATSLDAGLAATYAWYLSHENSDAQL